MIIVFFMLSTLCTIFNYMVIIACCIGNLLLYISKKSPILYRWRDELLPAISDKRCGRENEGRTERENDDKTKKKPGKHLFFFWCYGIIRSSEIDSVEMGMRHIICGNWTIISIQSI